ncbi:MAG: hypothetical protein ACXWE1_02175 [Thermoanaerobaculia bacterium]
MRVDQAQAKRGPNDLLVAAVMDLSLVVAALLSMGSAPTKHATFSIESARPEAAVLASTTADAASSREAIAEGSSLDQQLD